MVTPFTWLNNRKFAYGPGSRWNWLELYKKTPLIIVTGESSLDRTGQWSQWQDRLDGLGWNYRRLKLSVEPSPHQIDLWKSENLDFNPQLVIGLGGGSVMDGAKALAAMFCHEGKLIDYLEGVGTRAPQGNTLPMIAIPTTSGTGSEVTKNAVLSQPGPRGFKKSLRHDAFIPEMALLDPELMINCPGNTTLFAGMDCFTQLLEGYISKNSNPFSQMTARQGLELFIQGFPKVLDRPEDLDSRGKMALAAYLSGQTLAHAGLGTIHGLAGTLGGLYSLPHGEICARLIPVYYSELARISGSWQEKLADLGNMMKENWQGVDSHGVEGLLQGLNWMAKQLPAKTHIPSVEILKKTAQLGGDKNSPFKTSEEFRYQLLSQGLT